MSTGQLIPASKKDHRTQTNSTGAGTTEIAPGKPGVNEPAQTRGKTERHPSPKSPPT